MARQARLHPGPKQAVQGCVVRSGARSAQRASSRPAAGARSPPAATKIWSMSSTSRMRHMQSSTMMRAASIGSCSSGRVGADTPPSPAAEPSSAAAAPLPSPLAACGLRRSSGATSMSGRGLWGRTPASGKGHGSGNTCTRPPLRGAAQAVPAIAAHAGRHCMSPGSPTPADVGEGKAAQALHLHKGHLVGRHLLRGGQLPHCVPGGAASRQTSERAWRARTKHTPD